MPISPETFEEWNRETGGGCWRCASPSIGGGK